MNQHQIQIKFEEQCPCKTIPTNNKESGKNLHSRKHAPTKNRRTCIRTLRMKNDPRLSISECRNRGMIPTPQFLLSSRKFARFSLISSLLRHNVYGRELGQ